MTDQPDTTKEETETAAPASAAERGSRSVGNFIRTAEIDTRLLGMIGALIVIWIAFNIMSGGTFLTPRNLWNLTVQTSVVAIMASGMVLIIVSRNIDLSVGAMLAAIGMAMALLQSEILPDIFGIGHPMVWIVSLAAGVAMGAAIRRAFASSTRISSKGRNSSTRSARLISTQATRCG